MNTTSLIRSITTTVRRIVLLMAESGGTDDESRQSCSAPAGGILNYRTERLDDGTDPIGWYEED